MPERTLIEVGWYTFPSQWGPWKPSKVHLARDPYSRPLCGARKPTRARHSAPADMHEHERDAGRCQRCQRSATRAGAVPPS